jgi:hypothetical protein
MSKPMTTLATSEAFRKELPNVDASREDILPCNRYKTTSEAAQYLRKSVSWILRQGDIPYLPGRPNVYATEDLDSWVERHKHQPLN